MCLDTKVYHCNLSMRNLLYRLEFLCCLDVQLFWDTAKERREQCKQSQATSSPDADSNVQIFVGKVSIGHHVNYSFYLYAKIID